MILAFTICSNNYLAYAGVLCASLKKQHPDWFFLLGLVDECLPPETYEPYGFDAILPVSQIKLVELASLQTVYNIIELNTAVKPFYISHLLNHYPDAHAILYFDPDIKIFARLDTLVAHLSNADIVLVPHFTTPQHGQPGIITPEQRILQRGLYNLGFLALRRSSQSEIILHWWQDRVAKLGYLKPEKGLFVDQKWMDLAPVFFDHITILKQPGYDVAYWNLYENDLKIVGQEIFSGDSPLYFYHFSAFPIDSDDYIEQLVSRFTGEKSAAIRKIYRDYKSDLLALGHNKTRKHPYAYQRKIPLFTTLKNLVKRNLQRWLDL